MDKFKKLICVIPFCGFNIIIIDKTQQNYIYNKYFGKDSITLKFNIDDCLNAHFYLDAYSSTSLDGVPILEDIDKIINICDEIGAYGCIENISDEDIVSCDQNISRIFKIHDYESLKLYCDLNFYKVDFLNKTIHF